MYLKNRSPLRQKSQLLRSRLAIRIKIRFLPNAYGPIPKSLAQPFIVERRTMKRTPVVPDCYNMQASAMLSTTLTIQITHTKVIRISPLKPNSQIMILQNSIIKLLQQLSRLIGIQIINVFREWSDGIDALPACDGIRSYDWMDSSKLASNILRTTSSIGVYANFIRIILRGIKEARADESRSQPLDELLVGL